MKATGKTPTLTRCTHVKSIVAIQRKCQHIRLVKPEWVARLRLDIYTNHLKTSTSIAHTTTTSTTTKIE